MIDRDADVDARIDRRGERYDVAIPRVAIEARVRPRRPFEAAALRYDVERDATVQRGDVHAQALHPRRSVVHTRTAEVVDRDGEAGELRDRLGHRVGLRRVTAESFELRVLAEHAAMRDAA